VATDGNGDPLSYSATGLPAGLAISASTGLITGTPTVMGTNAVTVTASDGRGGVGSASFSWSIVDSSAPTAPSSLKASSSAGRVQLTWTGSTDNVGVVGYYVYRSTKTGSLGPQVATTSTTNWADTSVVVGLKYTYAVKAYDAAGKISARSNFSSVTVR
jgi:fibronectin type 3 domain-containing protein